MHALKIQKIWRFEFLLFKIKRAEDARKRRVEEPQPTILCKKRVNSIPLLIIRPAY
jgi:hypothetical protein